MSSVVKGIFGGSDDSGQKAQAKFNQEQLKLQSQLAAQARGDVTNLFPIGDVNRNLGFQSALDALARGTGEQLSVYRQGANLAQQQLAAGAPQFENAILGRQVDYVDPRSIGVDASFVNQQLPSFLGVGNISQAQQVANDPQAAIAALAGGGAGSYPFMGDGADPNAPGVGGVAADPVGMSTAAIEAELSQLSDPVNIATSLLTPFSLQSIFSFTRKNQLQNQLDLRSQPHPAVSASGTGIDQAVDPTNPQGISGGPGPDGFGGGTGSGTGAGVGHGGPDSGGYGGGDMGGV